LTVLLGLNFVNPEAVVVALNTNHAQAAHKIDGEYLGQLSSDATPALLASRASLDPMLRSQVEKVACAGERAYSAPPAAFNWSDAQAAAARGAGC
jgi:putative aminopeptidase FrvX